MTVMQQGVVAAALAGRQALCASAQGHDSNLLRAAICCDRKAYKAGQQGGGGGGGGAAER